MRSVLIRTNSTNGLSSVVLASVDAGAELDLFEKRAYELRKKVEPVKTKVGKYVERRHPAVSRKLAKLLSAAGKRFAAEVAAAYAKVAKSETDDLVAKILKQLNLTGLSIDLVGELTPELLRAFTEAGIYGVAQVGFEATPDITDQLDVRAQAYAEERGGELIDDLTTTTRDSLQSTLSRAVEEGMSTSKLSDAIQELGVFGEARADVIARTELAFAHVQGNVEGWKATGEDVQKRSILGDLHDHEDECDECADAGVVAMYEEFIPGYDFPPYHPNCLCDILPVLADQSEGENQDDTESED